MARSELTDDEWELIEPLLPIGQFGPYPKRLRQQFEGVVWRFRTGSPWRDMPPEYGPWKTTYNRFLKWRDAGVFEALMGRDDHRGRPARADGLSLVSVDSTVARAHHDAAGMRVSPEVLATLEKTAGKEKGDGGRDERRRSEQR